MSDGARANPIRHGAFENAAGRIVEGRVQRQIRRSFIASSGKPLTTTEILQRAYPGASRQHWHYWNLRRAMPKYAVAIGRGSGYGPPTLWRPNDELARRIRGDRG
jgi:hypothetical protein